MESRLFQYSIPHFSFDNAKFHSMGNEDHSMGNEDHWMGNEDLFDGERGAVAVWPGGQGGQLPPQRP